MAEENKNNNASQAENATENNENNSGAENSAEKKYTDEDMNALVKKNSDKAVAKLMKELGITDTEKAKTILQKAAEEDAKKNANTGNEADSALKSELAEAKHSHELAVLENVFLTSAVQPTKVEKAVRLIELEKCRDEDGNFSREKAKAEVDSLLKEWPELKMNTEDKAGFVIGSDGKEEKKTDDMAAIKRAMGL